jgi:hypothetical protein
MVRVSFGSHRHAEHVGWPVHNLERIDRGEPRDDYRLETRTGVSVRLNLEEPLDEYSLLEDL